MSIFDITIVFKDDDEVILHEEEFDLVTEDVHGLNELLAMFYDTFSTHVKFPSYNIYSTETKEKFDLYIFSYVFYAQRFTKEESEALYNQHKEIVGKLE
jgi:hypothetical protein